MKLTAICYITRQMSINERAAVQFPIQTAFLVRD